MLGSKLGSEENILLGIEIWVEEYIPLGSEEGDLLNMELDVVKNSLLGIELKRTWLRRRHGTWFGTWGCIKTPFDIDLGDELGSELGLEEGELLDIELGRDLGSELGSEEGIVLSIELSPLEGALLSI